MEKSEGGKGWGVRLETDESWARAKWRRGRRPCGRRLLSQRLYCRPTGTAGAAREAENGVQVTIPHSPFPHQGLALT